MKKFQVTLVVAFVVGFNAPLHSADYECQQGSCFSKLFHDGALVGVRFEEGDIVSTEAGFVVDTDGGWVRVD